MMPNSPTAVIADVDGTLCDVTTALHHLEGLRRDFDAFHEATAQCPPTPGVIDWCRRQVAEGHVLVVVTARKYRHQELTEQWLYEHLLPTPFVGPLMRGDHDDRPDDEVKRHIHQVITEEMGYRVVAAIDDRPRVIALWRSLGIPTTVVHRPDWEAQGERYDPTDLPPEPTPPIAVPPVWAHLKALWPDKSPEFQVAKVGEEAGEALGAMIKTSEGRPVKDPVEAELADTIIAAIAALQAYGRDPAATVAARWEQVAARPLPSSARGERR